MKNMIISALIVCATTASASAMGITIDLPEGSKIDRSNAIYSCGDHTIPVEYINADSVSLAVLSIDNKLIVASNVISASGAKYAGGQYVWWTKGNYASLYDLIQGENAPAVACTAVR